MIDLERDLEVLLFEQVVRNRIEVNLLIAFDNRPRAERLAAGVSAEREFAVRGIENRAWTERRHAQMPRGFARRPTEPSRDAASSDTGLRFRSALVEAGTHSFSFIRTVVNLNRPSRIAR